MLKFAAVGLTNTAITFLLFQLFLRLLGSALVAQAIGYSAGVIWSFWWNKSWTFGRGNGRARAASDGPERERPYANGASPTDRGETVSDRTRFARFVTLQLVLLIVTSSVIGLCVDIWGWPAIPTWLCVTALATIINYSVSKMWVFEHTP